MVQLGAMPLPRFIALLLYTWEHPEARVSSEDPAALKAYLGARAPLPAGSAAAGGSQLQRVHVFARCQDVLANEPVARFNLIEPGEPPLIGMAAIAVPLEDLVHVRRHLDLGCSRLGWDAWTHALEDDECSSNRDGELG